MESPIIVFAVVILGIGSMISAVMSVLTYLRMNHLEHSTNSKMDLLLDTTETAALARGKKDAEDEAASQ